MFTQIETHKSGTWNKFTIGGKSTPSYDLSEITERLADLEYFVNSTFNTTISDIIESDASYSGGGYIIDVDDNDSDDNDSDDIVNGGSDNKKYSLYLTLDQLIDDIKYENDGNYILDKSDLPLCATLIHLVEQHYTCVEVKDSPGPWMLIDYKVRNSSPVKNREIKRALAGERIEVNFKTSVDMDGLTSIIIDKFD